MATLSSLIRLLLLPAAAASAAAAFAAAFAAAATAHSKASSVPYARQPSPTMPHSSFPSLPLLLLLLLAVSTSSAAAPQHAPSAQVHKDDTGKTVFKDPNGNIVTYDPTSSAHFRYVLSLLNHYPKPLMFLFLAPLSPPLSPCSSPRTSSVCRTAMVRVSILIYCGFRVVIGLFITGTALTGFQAIESFQLGKFRWWRGGWRWWWWRGGGWWRWRWRRRRRWWWQWSVAFVSDGSMQWPWSSGGHHVRLIFAPNLQPHFPLNP